MNYCTYLTIYSGNKLPPFYIGSTSIYKIKAGYVGSVSSMKYESTWRLEKRTNPHLFKVKIIKTFETREDAIDHEIFLQKSLDVVRNPLYTNLVIAGANFGGLSGKDSPMYGKIVSEETREKLRIANRNRDYVASEATRKKISIANSGENNYWYGKSLPEEIREKIRQTLTGRPGTPHTEESKKKISEGNKGRIMSEETKERLRVANTGKKVSDETKKKMSDFFKQIERTEEWCKKIGDANRNRVVSEETKKKISTARTGKPLSEDHKKKIGDGLKGKMSGEKNPMYGKKMSPENRKKLQDASRAARLGVPAKEETKQKISDSLKKRSTCIHCGMESNVSNITRYHMNNCKFKNLVDLDSDSVD